MRVRREVAAAIAIIALTACGAAADASPDASPNTPLTGTDAGAAAAGGVSSTLSGVGVLPSQAEHDVQETADPADASGSTADEATTTDDDGAAIEAEEATTTTRARRAVTTSTSTTVPAEEPVLTVGEQVHGNRVLMIGDSILASTSRRYGNNMCRALVPLGWQVAVEAEVSREITFGNRVLRSRMAAGWDAAVILLGNNYGQNPNLFMAELDKMLSTLAPRPVLLLTVTEFEPVQREVNDIIRALAEIYPNVTVFDWATVSRFPGVLSGDGLHLTDNGREFLALQLVPYFGVAPVQPGDCLSSTFHDDSAGSVDGPPASSKPSSNKPPTTSKPTVSTARPTVTTARPTATTVRSTGAPATTTSAPAPVATVTLQTNPPQTSPPPTSPPPTSPPQTSPPQTSPPQTSPPPTSPPQTNPPQTNPPQTSPPQTNPPD